MSIFSRINEKISNNLYAHGHYSTDPHAHDAEKIAEMVDDLTEFVEPAARAQVRAAILDIIRQHKHQDVELE